MSASPASIDDETSEVKPYQTMRGHTSVVCGVAHLPDGQRIITCSWDGTFRLWERESSTQIGNAWEDQEDDEEDDEDDENFLSMALSPNGKTVATGHHYGTVKSWNMEMKKVTAKWTGHIKRVSSVCWSGDGRLVVSGSRDGTARVWDVESGETALGPIETGHKEIDAVAFSPDTSIFATGGFERNGIKLWDARTSEPLSTLEQVSWVESLVWTSDQKMLLAGNDNGSIAIFDTITWQQIALLDDHGSNVTSLSLIHNDRLLASGSADKTARLWNLDTNLPVGPPLQHHSWINDTAFSPDGRFLATACEDHSAYVWDVHAILLEADLGDLLSTSNVTAEKSILDSDATRHSKKPKEHLTIAPRGFFDSSTPFIDLPTPTVHLDPPSAMPPVDLSPPTHSNAPSTHVRRHPLAPFTLSGAGALLGRISTRFSRSQSSTVEPTELRRFLNPGNVSVHAPADSAVQDIQFDAALPLAMLQHTTDKGIAGQRYDTSSIHLAIPHPLVNHTTTKYAADVASHITNFNSSRPSPDIKRKQKQRGPDKSALKVVDVPLGEATYGDYVANREDVVRPYSLFCCLSWCQKKDEKQHSSRQQYDIELLYPEQENATSNDPMSTTEVRPTIQQEEFELSVIASQPQPEAGPSRLPGSARH